MSNYKHFKHYYNPYDSLDVEWQHVVSKGYLTIGEIVCLSGYTKSYIYRLVKNGVIPSLIENDGRKVKWTDFVHWYSHLLETPSSPIGESSFSIYGLMNYTGMGRSWLLSFVERYNIKSYHVGWLKRYSKDDVLKAWTEELCFIKLWLNINEVEMGYKMRKKDLFNAVAQNIVHIKHANGVILFNRQDIIRWKEGHYE